MTWGKVTGVEVVEVERKPLKKARCSRQCHHAALLQLAASSFLPSPRCCGHWYASITVYTVNTLPVPFIPPMSEHQPPFLPFANCIRSTCLGIFCSFHNPIDRLSVSLNSFSPTFNSSVDSKQHLPAALHYRTLHFVSCIRNKQLQTYKLHFENSKVLIPDQQQALLRGHKENIYSTSLAQGCDRRKPFQRALPNLLIFRYSQTRPSNNLNCLACRLACLLSPHRA